MGRKFGVGSRCSQIPSGTEIPRGLFFVPFTPFLSLPPLVGDQLKAKLAGIGPTIGLDASPFSLELPPGKMGRGGGEYDRMADGLRGQEGESHRTGASCTEPGRGQGEKLMGVE